MKENSGANIIAGAVIGGALIGAVRKQSSWSRTRARWIAFDALHAVDTGAGAAEQVLEYPSGNNSYAPAPWKTLPYVIGLASLPVQGFTFVDIGCGKGKVLLSALQYPFARIAGVEYSPYLCQVAQKNVAAARLLRRRCTNVEITCADAVEYPVPEGPVIFFFANPFTDDLMERMLQNILSSYWTSPRPMYLIFYAASSRLLRITDFLRRERGDGARPRASGLVGKRTVYVFELLWQ